RANRCRGGRNMSDNLLQTIENPNVNRWLLTHWTESGTVWLGSCRASRTAEECLFGKNGNETVWITSTPMEFSLSDSGLTWIQGISPMQSRILRVMTQL